MLPPKKLRGIIHCHSRYSYDCMIPPAAYITAACRLDLNFVVLTDHDSVAGSLELATLARDKMPDLEVPMAAEYCTEYGDVIAMFLQREISVKRWDDFVSQAREQNALLLLPHPYVAHREIDRLARECDLLEVLNSRASREKNAAARELAATMKKPTYEGSDAHLERSIDAAILELQDIGGLRASLLGSVVEAKSRLTEKWETSVSQAIKAWKKKDPVLAARQSASLAKYFVKKALGN